ncbi:unnamed protein product [Fusarium venenatum]|uniref:Major facilitator superfamily (MFS) profile domain-containing protein n=1 Tax=Fusarium venenatum TaxID=56646 RepID=A0A2L2THE8_9HYPO|nr:uncharacterized protein FVRRES_10471 [Fusarium venenatum]CEI70394.1 unnamed protein product [Fusarium venenatum]
MHRHDRINTIGATLQAYSYSLPQLIIGRLVSGYGFGHITATAPNWQAECSGAAHRGAAVMLQGLFISPGLVIGGWTNLGMSFHHGCLTFPSYPLSSRGTRISMRSSTPRDRFASCRNAYMISRRRPSAWLWGGRVWFSAGTFQPLGYLQTGNKYHVTRCNNLMLKKAKELLKIAH